MSEEMSEDMSKDMSEDMSKDMSEKNVRGYVRRNVRRYVRSVKAHPCYSLSHCMHASDVDCPIALAQKGAVRLTVISGLKPVNSGYQP